jgi:hypothetical protein
MYRSTFSWLQHLLEVSGQLHASALVPSGAKSPWYPLVRTLIGDLDPVRTTWHREMLLLQGLELRPLGSPANSQSIYRLSYRGVFFGALQNASQWTSYFNLRMQTYNDSISDHFNIILLSIIRFPKLYSICWFLTKPVPTDLPCAPCLLHDQSTWTLIQFP